MKDSNKKKYELGTVGSNPILLLCYKNYLKGEI